MRLFKQTYRDRQGVVRATGRWYTEFRFDERMRRVPLFSDKSSSADGARQIERLMAAKGAGEAPDAALNRWLETTPQRLRSRLVEIGLLDGRRVASSKALGIHLEDFKAALLAKGGLPRHAELVYSRARKVIEGCGFVFWSHISASKVQAFVGKMREDRENAKGISNQTANFYLAAVKQFCRWAVRDGRASESPVQYLEGWNIRTDRRHDRRALTVDEIQRLLTAAEVGPVRRGMTGPDRAMLYRLALETGLRAGELRSLTRGSFRLTGDQPAVIVGAAYSKRKREDVQPLRPSMARAVQSYLGTKMPHMAAFNVPRRDKVSAMIQGDLEAARRAWIEEARSADERAERARADFLAYRDAAGRVADFHSLRHTFISNLASGGVHPKTAQALARHSTITLTMDRYSHVLRGAESAALAALPDLTSAAPARRTAPSSRRAV